MMYSPYSTVANGESFGCFDEAGTALAKLPTKVKKNEEVHPFEHPGFALWSRAQWQGADFATDARNSAGSKLRAAITAFAPFSRPRGVIPKQRGILMAVRKSTVDAAMATIKMVRATGCMLKAELWYRRGEVREAVLQQLKTLDVQPMMFEYYVDSVQLEPACWNWQHMLLQLKPLAIIHSGFAEVLYVDTTVAFLRDPSYLFEHETYRLKGTVFWPSLWRASALNPVWGILGVDADSSFEQDSSVILVNKAVAWEALQYSVAMYIEYFLKMVPGDTDMLRMAWLTRRVVFHAVGAVPTVVGTMDPASGKVCGHSLQQHGLDGDKLYIRLGQNADLGTRLQLQFTHAIVPTKGNQDRVHASIADITLASSSHTDPDPCYKLEVISKVAGDTAMRVVSEALEGMSEFQRQFVKMHAQAQRFFASLPPLGGLDMNVDAMLI